MLRKLMMVALITGVVILGLQCDWSDPIGDASNVAGKASDAVVDTTSGLGNQMRKGKQNMRDTAGDY